MANKQQAKTARELRRRRHVRNRIHGTAARPRLAVTKSLRNTSAQLIDDQKCETLAFVTSQVLAAASDKGKNKIDIAKEVGQSLARMALDKGIKCAVFDRNRYIYHGRVKAVAEGAREGGLQI